MLEIVTFQDAEGWGLRVNGKDYMRGESYGVVSAVEEALRRGASGTSEADELADSILTDAAVDPC